LDLIRMVDYWKGRAVTAESALETTQHVAGKRYTAMRRIIARELHPDSVPAGGVEHALRTTLFQRIWSVVEEMDSRPVRA
jgi:hypothetical protein